MLTFAVAAVLSQSEPEPDRRFMCQAVYAASSPIEDASAPGGFGTSKNLPSVVSDRALLSSGPTATLRKADGGFTVHLTNGGRADAWFTAADSNVMGWLEAKDAKGAWVPIEWKYWYTCGNSFHRVALPQGYGWAWRVDLPSGTTRTKVRWHYEWNKETLVSNEVAASLPAQRFSLPPETAKDHVVDMKYRYPMLREAPSGFEP